MKAPEEKQKSQREILGMVLSKNGERKMKPECRCWEDSEPTYASSLCKLSYTMLQAGLGASGVAEVVDKGVDDSAASA